MPEKPTYERKGAEETLAWLASFPEQDPDPVIEIDLDGKVTYLNPVTAMLFPHLPETAFQHPILEGLLSIIALLKGRKEKTVTREIAIDGSVYEQRITYLQDRNLIRIFARDITERKQAEEALRRERDKLQDALDKVKTLSGLLPICSNCKKIRDDKGYWNQIEAYIRDHSEVDFSHSICPECAKKLYPDFYKGD